MTSVTKLRAYHNDPAIKEKHLARVRAHAQAGAITQGIGWENGKGCAIGCTLESYDHSRYPIELGMPEWLARLEDAIFEGLPKGDAMEWPEAFLEDITPGAELEPVRHKLAMRRMDRLIAGQRENLGKHGESIDGLINKTIAAIQKVRSCHEAELGGNVCDWSKAGAAAEAAESAAQSAAQSALAAAYSAYSVKSSTWYVSWSVDAAARAAPYSLRSAYMQEASDLLYLLRTA